MENDPQPIRHRIERTRNRHSRAVCKGDTIIIRLARNLSPVEEREHVESLLRRMRTLVLRERKKQPVDPFRPLLEGAERLDVTLGNGKRLVFRLSAASRTRAKRTADGWDIGVGPRIRRDALHRYLWNLVAAKELPRITDLVHAINRRTLCMRVADVRLRFATSQWGSCSPRGVIMLNTALLFLPEPLLEYVIVHELAHCKIAGHPLRYWKLVESALPDYEEAYAALKRYRLH